MPTAILDWDIPCHSRRASRPLSIKSPSDRSNNYANRREPGLNTIQGRFSTAGLGRVGLMTNKYENVRMTMETVAEGQVLVVR